ncbi:MAG: peptidoglycan DD-metalloendopeptidase family protein [Bacillota bacterium]
MGTKKIFILFMLFIFLIIGCQNTNTQAIENEETNNPLKEPHESQELKEFTEPLLIKISKTEIFPGDFFSVLIFNTQDNDEIKFTSPFLNFQNEFYPLDMEKIRFVGVNYRTKPGPYDCQIQVMRNGTSIFNESFTIHVNHKQFPTQHLKVTQTQLNIRTSDRRDDDAKYVRIAKSVSSSAPLWEGAFLLPLQGRISTEYGVIRYINNEESGRHAGIDIAALRSTPIKATNSGIVTLTRNQLVTGNTVVIDHGMDIFSSYAHLHKIYVKQGQYVRKGDIIGEVGSTGFSTGPHLHWTISLKDIFVNPWLFIESDPLPIQ